MSEQNDNQTHTSEPIEGVVLSPGMSDEEKIAYAIIGGIGVFLLARAGTRSAMRPLMKELRKIGQDAYFNAGVSYDNVNATIENGNIILDAIKRAQPAIDAINAVQGR